MVLRSDTDCIPTLPTFRVYLYIYISSNARRRLALRPNPPIFTSALTDTAQAVPLGVEMNMCEDEPVSREGFNVWCCGRRELLQTLPSGCAFLAATSSLPVREVDLATAPHRKAPREAEDHPSSPPSCLLSNVPPDSLDPVHLALFRFERLSEVLCTRFRNIVVIQPVEEGGRR